MESAISDTGGKDESFNAMIMSLMADDRFVIYRADPKGFNELLVSSRMASHHMPHVYKQVMESLDIQGLRQMTYDE